MHGNRRRTEYRGECPRPHPVTIAGPRLAHPHRPGRSQRRVQLLLHDAFDGVANSRAHHALDGVRTDLAPFSRVPLPAIASHAVILRHPLPSGRSCRPTAPDDDAFLSLFHHTADIANGRSVPKLWKCRGGEGRVHQRPSFRGWPEVSRLAPDAEPSSVRG